MLSLLLGLVTIFYFVRANVELNSEVSAGNKIFQHLPSVETSSNLGSWQYFQFTNPGTYALTRWEFTTPDPILFQITDLYCSGDVFKVYINDTYFGQTSITGYPASCVNSTANPAAAFFNAEFSKGSAFLYAGFVNFTILVAQSPWTAGTAALRFARIPDTLPIAPIT